MNVPRFLRLPVVKVFFCILGVELLSAAVIFFPVANSIAAIILTLLCLILTIYRPEIGLTAMAGELVIGSKGGLFRLGGDEQNNGGLPIRILLFSAFWAGWFIWSIRTGSWKHWHGFLKGRGIYFVLGLVLVQAFVRGLIHQTTFVFADANSWGMWLLLLPVLTLVTTRFEPLKKILLPTIEAGLLWIAFKTLLLFYLFSHAFSPVFLDTVYLWVRRTGVGEITRASGHAYRIFFQSHVYALFVVIAIWARQVVRPQGIQRKEWLFLVLALGEILISLSRSFWLGLAAGGVMLAGWFLTCYRRNGYAVVKTVLGSSVLGILLVAGLLWFPLPPSDGSLSLLVRSRIDANEDAATSRWKLLPILWAGVKRAPLLGSGFGAMVTYESHDPRVVQATGGQYTTYAFEWGWLDLWYKLGLIGVIVLAALLIRLGLLTWRLQEPEAVRWAVFAGLLLLAVVHFFTPYLNHPLGFGVLLALEGWIASRPSRLVKTA